VKIFNNKPEKKFDAFLWNSYELAFTLKWSPQNPIWTIHIQKIISMHTKQSCVNQNGLK